MRVQHKSSSVTTLAGLACAIFLTTCLAHDGWDTQDARELSPGASIERELSGGEAHAYRISLIEGQYVRALVKGQDINLLVTLQEPGGERSLREAEITGFGRR